MDIKTFDIRNDDRKSVILIHYIKYNKKKKEKLKVQKYLSNLKINKKNNNNIICNFFD